MVCEKLINVNNEAEKKVGDVCLGEACRLRLGGLSGPQREDGIVKRPQECAVVYLSLAMFSCPSTVA